MDSIELFRQKLNEAIEKFICSGEDLSKNELLELSRKLDNEILKFYKIDAANRIDNADST